MTKWRFPPLCFIAVLAGCHGDSSDLPVSQATTHIRAPAAVKRGPSPEELTAGMVEAATVGPATAPVAVKFDLGAAATVGAPAVITIAVMPRIQADAAVLQVMGSDKLVLAPGASPIQMLAVEPSQVYRHTVTVTPTAEGVQLLALSVSLSHDDVTEKRDFSVPIIVASPGDAPSAARDTPSAAL